MRRTPGLQVHDGPVRVLVPKLGGLHNILGLTPLILRCGCGPGRGRGRLAGLALFSRDAGHPCSLARVGVSSRGSLPFTNQTHALPGRTREQGLGEGPCQVCAGRALHGSVRSSCSRTLTAPRSEQEDRGPWLRRLHLEPGGWVCLHLCHPSLPGGVHGQPGGREPGGLRVWG